LGTQDAIRMKAEEKNKAEETRRQRKVQAVEHLDEEMATGDDDEPKKEAREEGQRESQVALADNEAKEDRKDSDTYLGGDEGVSA